MRIIRPENPTDQTAISEINELAFGRPNEAQLVEALRATAAFTLSLVAEQDNQLVGHILFTPLTIVDEAGAIHTALGLGPLAVLPVYQNQGIGGQLVRQGLAECRQAGHGLVIVLGHRTYYPRFGFVAAANHHITYSSPLPDGVFMLAELQPGACQGIRGVVHYHHAFAQV